MHLHARNAFVWHALEQADVEAQLIPLDGRALDADEGEGNAGLPLLRGLQDQIVQRLADLRVLSIERVYEGWGHKTSARMRVYVLFVVVHGKPGLRHL